jgi:hypothetical protein
LEIFFRLDQDTQSPIPGVHILVIGSNPSKGSITDSQGQFIIEKVQVGRISFRISSMGYEDVVVQNLRVSSAKELIVFVSFRESILKMEEMVINGNEGQGEILNELATVSGRAFSVEETKRYAGSFNDPARMVSSFAGVITAPKEKIILPFGETHPKGISGGWRALKSPTPILFPVKGLPEARSMH